MVAVKRTFFIEGNMENVGKLSPDFLSKGMPQEGRFDVNHNDVDVMK